MNQETRNAMLSEQSHFGQHDDCDTCSHLNVLNLIAKQWSDDWDSEEDAAYDEV